MASSTNHKTSKPARVHTPWSAADDEALTIMYTKGTPIDSVAQILGRSPKGVYARAGHLKLKRTRAPIADNRVEEQLDLFDSEAEVEALREVAPDVPTGIVDTPKPRCTPYGERIKAERRSYYLNGLLISMLSGAITSVIITLLLNLAGN